MENYLNYCSSVSKWGVGGTSSSSDPPFSVQTPLLLPHHHHHHHHHHPHVSDSCSVQLCEFPNSNSWPLLNEDRAASASKSHSQAEKRRRDRINAQLATLRKLIPKSDKMDKAALLGSVIEHVKDLKRKAMDIGTSFTVPTEIDEVLIDHDPLLVAQEGDNNKVNYKLKGSGNPKIVIKASVCCEDRPELFSELIQVLKGLRLTAVKAEIASVGGRIKSIFVLCCKDSEDSVCLTTLKHSLKSAVTKIAASSSVASNCPARSKRQRFFLPARYLH